MASSIKDLFCDRKSRETIKLYAQVGANLCWWNFSDLLCCSLDLPPKLIPSGWSVEISAGISNILTEVIARSFFS